jgi:hypothetical protein
MARKKSMKPRRVNLTIDESIARALDQHRSALAKERGMPVTESDAVRDAIVRTGR